MHQSLAKNIFLVKEHVGMFKAANNFDIYDPEQGKIIMECREEKLGFWTKWFRFTKYKRYTPFDITIKATDGTPLVRVTRGVTFIKSKVAVYDEKSELIGWFKQKLFSIGGAFDVLDDKENVVCNLKGKWTGWDFKFVYGDKEFAQVTKKWAGIGKELFTSADNYILKIAEVVPADSPLRPLILAAVMCIDMVLKE